MEKRDFKFLAKFQSDGDFIWHRWKIRINDLVTWNKLDMIAEGSVTRRLILSWLIECWFVILCIVQKFSSLFVRFNSQIVSGQVSSITSLESNVQIFDFVGSHTHILEDCVNVAIQLCSINTKECVDLAYTAHMNSIEISMSEVN